MTEEPEKEEETPEESKPPVLSEEEETEETEVIEEEESSWEEIWMPSGNIIRNPSDAMISLYTSRPALIEKFDDILAGRIGLTDWEGNEVLAPLGSFAVKPGLTLWACDRRHTGQSCFIYALGIYYTLFGEDPYLNNRKSITVSKAVHIRQASKAAFEAAGIRNEPGAYFRTAGHSLIVLGYDDEGIDVIQGNVGGTGFICISQYTWEEFNAAILLSGTTYIEVVYQPSDAYFNEAYPLDEAEEETEQGESDSFAARSVKGSSSFIYDEDMFISDPQTLNPEIAKTAMALSSMVKRPDDIRNAFIQMGIEEDDILIETESDSFTLAYEPLLDSEERAYDLYLIAVKGSDPSQWFSEYETASEGYHPGFYAQADVIEEKLNEFIAEHTQENAKRIFLFTGYDSGGSAANIIAERFSASEDNDRVFAYTFGAPPVTKLTKEQDEARGYDSSLGNIFNFINPDDFAVRYMELLEGYDRNGQTVFLTKQNDNAVWMNFENRFETVNAKPYEYVSSEDLNNALSLLSYDNETEYKTAFENTLKMLEAEEPYTAEALLQQTGAQADVLNEIFVKEMTSDHDPTGKLTEVRTKLDELLAMMNDAQNADEKAAEALMKKAEELKRYLNQGNARVTDDFAHLSKQLYAMNNELNNLSPSLFTYLSLFVSTDRSPAELINDAHKENTYHLWISSMYYGDYGWYGYQDQIRLPDFKAFGIRSIGAYCFANTQCKGSLNLNGIRAVGEYAFEGSTYTSLQVNADMEMLGDGAFGNMKSLNRVYMPVDLAYTWDGRQNCNPFRGDTQIRELIYIPGEGTEMKPAQKEVNPDSLLETIAKENLQKITYAEGITSVSAYMTDRAMPQMKALTEVILPDTLETIGAHAFGGYPLKAVFVPDSLKEIASDAFEGNQDLILYGHDNECAKQFVTDQKLEYVNLPADEIVISLEERLIEIEEGQQAKLKVNLSEKAIEKGIVVTSADPAVAAVDETGMIIAKQPGMALISVSFGSIQDTCLVFVPGETNEKEGGRTQKRLSLISTAHR